LLSIPYVKLVLKPKGSSVSFTVCVVYYSPSCQDANPIGKTYGDQHYTQQQRNDALFDLVDKFSTMSKRLEFMWEHVFPKPDGSANRGKFVKVEDEAKKSTDGSKNY
jgi:hypothetical protein